MDVATVGAEDGFLAEKAADDGDQYFGDREGERHQRGRHAETGRRVTIPHEAVAAEQEADQQAARIAEKHRSGIEVVAQETEEAADEGQDGQRQLRVVIDDGRHEKTYGGEQSDAGGEAV